MLHGKGWALPFWGKHPKQGAQGGQTPFLCELELQPFCWKVDSVSLSSEAPAFFTVLDM